MAKWVPRSLALHILLVLWSCSNDEQVAKHASRGDELAQQHKLREAVIEYKIALQAAPGNPALQWKLAQVAITHGDLSTAFHALNQVVALNPSHFDARWSLGDLYVAAGKLDQAEAIAKDLIAADPQHPAGHFLLGKLALEANRPAEAIPLLKRAAELGRTLSRPRLALANLYFTQQNLSEAAHWYEEARRADATDPDVHVARGYLLFATGSAEKGRQAFQEALQSSRDQERIRLVLADRYAALGKRDDAEHELTALIAEMNSNHARRALAELTLSAGRIHEATALVKAVLDADAQDAAGIYLKGRLALAEGDRLQAAALFEDAIRRSPMLAAPHAYLGLIRSTQGRTEQAEDELREAIRLDPTNPMAHLTLAQIYLSQHKPLEAGNSARQALLLNPSNLEAAVMYGDALVLAKKWTEAEDVYASIIRQLPSHPIGYVKMAAGWNAQGHPSKAAPFLSQALSHAPSDPVIVQDYLMTLIAAKQTPRATEELRARLAKDARNPLLWRLAGGVYAAAGLTAEAEQAFKKSITLAPQAAQSYYELGQFHLRRGQLPAAESAFQSALKHDHDNASVHTALGMTAALQGRLESAHHHYRRAVQLDPRNVIAANNLAAGLVEQQEFDEALAFALAALDQAPDNPAVKDTLGWIYYKKHRFDDAYRFLREATAALPQHPSVRYHLAMTLAKNGRQADAIHELKAALSLSKSFPEADRAADMVAANRIDE